MTIQKISFRDFIRGHIPADILLLLDKKSNQSKGLYVTPEYAEDVLAFIKEKEREKQEKKSVLYLILLEYLVNWMTLQLHTKR